ncbi:MAG TPA: ABC transporter ATP-binding protein [Acidimicrobiia bacterium]|jgi:ABC-2 type transport system ATP-binding protein|nr:ABC transporter ATP-binding protein [Acidimicrobiia bacterium]
MEVLQCAGLRKTFDDLVAVDDVGFSIARGETYGLLGPNGAGKTTTISMIAGILEADAGNIDVCGEPVDTRHAAGKSEIGFVPQDLAIYPDLSARENLRFFGHLYDMRGAELKARVDEILNVIGLADRADDRAEEYSGGMKRRLNIGIGLLHEPKLLILDEPTVGVDPQSRNAILESVAALSDEGIGVLYTTHYMEEAERLCDRVAIIDSGRIQAEGTRRELVELVGGQDRIKLGVDGDAAMLAESLAQVSGVASVTHTDASLELLTADARTLLPELIAGAAAAGVAVTAVDVVEPNLEAVFLHLTGKALRD